METGQKYGRGNQLIEAPFRFSVTCSVKKAILLLKVYLRINENGDEQEKTEIAHMSEAAARYLPTT